MKKVKSIFIALSMVHILSCSLDVDNKKFTIEQKNNRYYILYDGDYLYSWENPNKFMIHDFGKYGLGLLSSETKQGAERRLIELKKCISDGDCTINTPSEYYKK